MTTEYKGAFISSKYSDIAKEFLEKEIVKQLNDIMQFAGIMDGETNNLSMQELKSQRKII